MTIIATAPFYQAGVLVAAGATPLNYSAEVEADLVRRGFAVYYGDNPQTGGAVPAHLTTVNGNTVLAGAGVGGDDVVLQGGGARCSATLPTQAVPIGDSEEPSGNHILNISAAAYDPYGLINTTTNEITIPPGHQRAEIFIDAQWFLEGGGTYRKLACEIYSVAGWLEYQYVMAPPSATDMSLPLIIPFKLLGAAQTKLRITANHNAATPQTIVIPGTRFTFYKT